MELEWKVALTPNPASDQVTFELDGIENKEVISFSIKNFEGKVVAKSQIKT
jgi:hypothetical protein